MDSLQKEKLPKVEKPKVNSEDVIKRLGGINVTINVVSKPDKQEDDEEMKKHLEMMKQMKCKEVESAKKSESINAEMLKIMKKEKEPIFEQGRELKAEKYIK